jgi:hypothetical protein
MFVYFIGIDKKSSALVRWSMGSVADSSAAKLQPFVETPKAFCWLFHVHQGTVLVSAR